MGAGPWGLQVQGCEQLLPGVNVARVMRNGRNFEYMSGEDPVLGARMLPSLVHGIQQSVMSITKHYILNNQETGRDGVRPL